MTSTGFLLAKFTNVQPVRPNGQITKILTEMKNTGLISTHNHTNICQETKWQSVHTKIVHRIYSCYYHLNIWSDLCESYEGALDMF